MRKYYEQTFLKKEEEEEKKAHTTLIQMTQLTMLCCADQAIFQA